MSSTTSPHGPSPIVSASPYDLTNTPSSEDDSWQYLDYSSSASVGFLPSPASGSLNEYAVLSHVPLPAESPQYLDLDQPQFPASASMSGGSDENWSGGMAEGDGFAGGDVGVGENAGGASFGASGSTFLTPQDLLLTSAQMDEIGDAVQYASATSGLFNNFTSGVPLQDLTVLPQQPDFHADEVVPWGKTEPAFPLELHYRSSSQSSPSPQVPPSKAAHSVRKRQTSKVGKKKSNKKDKSSAPPADPKKFVVITSDMINAQDGLPNPFDRLEEAFRTSQKGRKGPLANGTKESALQVRRLGACFCCHSRKVRCDKERPCRNCVKLAVSVPQVVCWQFQDFLPVLFPGFVRSHFRKEEMARFMEENVEGFGMTGPESGKGFEVELFSGPRFRSVLVIPGARFFTAKTSEVLTHWHLHAEAGGVDLLARGAVPIGLDPAGGTQRDEVKKRAKEYVRSILAEPAFADQLTETFRHTALPMRILQLVQRYWAQSESPVVRRALSVYTLHYILTRHLCMTRPNILSLASTALVPQNIPWVTPRVLNRQIKAVMDELMQRETQLVFDLFSKSLKPKSRREWTPSLAAFLVLCLFMESVETAADNFVVAQHEISLRGGGGGEEAEYGRKFALGVNEEIEKMPFRQFGFQFHQVYQTHSKDSSARAFNPLVDDDFVERGELDAAEAELVGGLRGLVEGHSRSELEYLAVDPIAPGEDSHPYPRDVAFDYTGRLVSKFLLSFTDEKYVFDA